jgi:hypothetical protein
MSGHPFFDRDESPPRDPDALPTSSDPSGPCTRCGRTSNFTALGVLPVTFTGGYSVRADGSGDQMPDWSVQAVALRCTGCGQCVIVIEEQYAGGQPSSATASTPARAEPSHGSGCTGGRLRAMAT